jgi:archaellum component FlaC
VKSIAKFVDKDHESKLNELENKFTSIYFLVEYVSNYFEKFITKLKRQNAIVTSLGINLKGLQWFENMEGNLTFNSTVELEEAQNSDFKV